MTKEKIQEIAFTMIGKIASPKYKALQAFRKYKIDGNGKEALKSLKDAEKELGDAGKHHLAIISSEAKQDDIPFSMMILHAEDQYMTVQMMIEILILLVDKKE